ncbi:myoneurin-like [Megalops cyprinoides]|uniref:myoneurin-like n=1 Tax=Megalops cyprinoides TaxID=118141 RepID=UPI0018654CB6|nr:myoneurin-like [Megalops cyprinoides]
MPPLMHCERLLERLRKQQERGFLCDCTVAIGQSRFRAHWNVLAAFSGYFSSLCGTTAASEDVTSLDPEWVTEAVFQRLIDFVYSGDLNVDSCNVTEVRKAATFLKMEEVVIQCTLTLEDVKPVCPEMVSDEEDLGASPSSLDTSEPHKPETDSVTSDEGPQGPVTLEAEEAPKPCVRAPERSTNRARASRRKPGSGHQGELKQLGPRVHPLLLEVFNGAGNKPADVPVPVPVTPEEQGGREPQMGSPPSNDDTDPRPSPQRPPVKRERERARKSCPLKENRALPPLGEGGVGGGPVGVERQGLLDEQLRAKPVCYTCGKVFSEASSLRRHMRIHRGVKPYVCQLCDKAFTQCNQLKTHVRTHTGEKPYQCDLCQKGFAQKCQLVFHSRMHHGEEKPYKCDVCGLQFATSSNLKIHSRKHSGEKPYVCDRCGQRFAQASTLTYHVRRHTGEKPYVCDTCGKAFAVSSSLITHSRKHTGEKPYVCQTCGKSFTSCGELNKHCRSHTGEKPFVCELCGNSYTDVKNLKKHKAKVHKDLPSPGPGQRLGVSLDDPVIWKATASGLVELKATEAPPSLAISTDHQMLISPPPAESSGTAPTDQLLRTAVGFSEPQFIFLQQLN